MNRAEFEAMAKKLTESDRTTWSDEARVAYQLGLQEATKTIQARMGERISHLEREKSYLRDEIRNQSPREWGSYG